MSIIRLKASSEDEKNFFGEGLQALSNALPHIRSDRTSLGYDLGHDTSGK